MKPLTFRIIIWILVSLFAFHLCAYRASAQPPAYVRVVRHNTGNLLNNPYFLLKEFPDTLIMGGFKLVVEEYESGEWSPLSGGYIHLTGLARIQFSCSASPWWQHYISATAVMQPVMVAVVDSVRNANGEEISIRDATALGIRTSIGSKVELLLPHEGVTATSFSRYLNEMAGLKRPEGIRVRFTDLTVHVPGRYAATGTVQTGTAQYPTDPAIPIAPFSLNVHPGFRLEVSSLTISQRGASAVAKLILPNSLAATGNCGGAALDLGNINLSPQCEFYKARPDSTYGEFGIGATTLSIQGTGYIADFSSTAAYVPSGQPNSWKGVWLLAGHSKGLPAGSVISNIGYLQADYAFSTALIESNGLTAGMVSSPYRYASSQPAGYDIAFHTGKVIVRASSISSGLLEESVVTLPRTAIRRGNDNAVVLQRATLNFGASMNLSGQSAIPDDSAVFWGDFVKAGGADRQSFGGVSSDTVWLFFSAQPRPAFMPVSNDGKQFSGPSSLTSVASLDANNMQGATIKNLKCLIINSPDIPGKWKPRDSLLSCSSSPLRLMIFSDRSMWLHVATEGVNCNIVTVALEHPGLELGNNKNPLYKGVEPFRTSITNTWNGGPGHLTLQCVESAVVKCDYRDSINLPEPLDEKLTFKEMVFTSTANNAGGKLTIPKNASLKYWGLNLLPRPGFSNAGLVSVKTGQVIITAAGLLESVHFAQPFWLTWGELLANGTPGRFFFDFNSAGQQFDGFNFVHDAVALSTYDPDLSVKSFLRVGGTVHFPFFGGDYLHIQDYYDPSMATAPYYNRRIALSSATEGAFHPTDSTIAGNWSNGLGVFDFTLKYADDAQDGFTGIGTSNLRSIPGGTLPSFLNLSRRGSCIRIGSDLNDHRSIALGPISNISKLQRIWGCACLQNDGISNLTIGGEITAAGNMMIASRSGSYLSAMLQQTPNLSKLTIDGEAYLSVAARLDALVNGHIQFTLNNADDFMEGEVAGKFRTVQDSVMAANSLEAEGQLNWHWGLNFHELQGMVKLKIMGTAAGTGVGAGFYIGNNAPKSRAWVLMSADPRYNLNMTAMPDLLTGIYGYLHVQNGVNLYVVSGEYDMFVGYGAFVLTPDIGRRFGGFTPGIGLPYVIGNLGGRIHGEILGGLVSAGAYYNLQLMLPYPLSFQGKVGLEGCVAWVVCKSIALNLGVNSEEGFYIR
ncbi:hypothetical protein [Chitinophaga sp. RAB17]|uniref:hypothetical protein n=1 Tax=Chitinophaga sp. RAB17 TaxID=3233049 RepID=UPI003F9013A5